MILQILLPVLKIAVLGRINTEESRKKEGKYPQQILQYNEQFNQKSNVQV